MEDTYQEDHSEKERHGCLTIWLLLMIVVNSLSSFAYLFLNEFILDTLGRRSISETELMLLGLLGLVNVGCAILIYNWKKIGFWGFLASSIIILVLNIYIGFEIQQAWYGLLGVFILYVLLHFEKNKVSAWDNFE